MRLDVCTPPLLFYENNKGGVYTCVWDVGTPLVLQKIIRGGGTSRLGRGYPPVIILKIVKGGCTRTSGTYVPPWYYLKNNRKK